MSKVERGLDGVIVDETAVCLADKTTDRLFYRGYAIEDLAEHAGYEEVAYLLIYGELPTASQLDEYRALVAAQRAVPDMIRNVLVQLPPDSDPMDVLRTGCSILGSLEPETKDGGIRKVACRLMGCMPGMLLHWHHHQRGAAVPADTGETTAAGHFLHLLQGQSPGPLLRRAIEVSLIVYAEHDFNASTFAARVATSTLSDGYSAYIAAVSTLRGPLHGSANASVLRFLTRFGSADEAEAAVKAMFAQKGRIPGFGQRAYSKADPRNAINRRWAKQLADSAGDRLLYDIADRVEQVVMREKGMFANLDYYTAIIYHLCGIPVRIFPAMFFLARLCGLAAHIAEQRANNRLIHPSSLYAGVSPRAFVPITQR